MGLFIPDEPDYGGDERKTGFPRYKELLSSYAGRWMKINLLTLLGAIPLVLGIIISILYSSIIILIPCSLVGGMIFGPFLAGLYDGILRGLRDSGENWWEAYKKSWRQNLRDSLLPGAILGLLAGMYSFMAALFWWAKIPPSMGTVIFYCFSAIIVLLINSLYWPQMVLFSQGTIQRIKNIILFTAKYLWRVLGIAILQFLYLLVYVLFAPWTLLLVPFLGLWYIIFLSQFFIYNALNLELEIEEQYNSTSVS